METAKKHFDNSSLVLSQEIKKILTKTSPIISDLMGHLTLSQGKNIRGKLVLLSSLDKDQYFGNISIQIAAAVEILHLATLIHDDIIDDAKKRRSNGSLHKEYGKRNAVLAGDYLFCLCFQILHDVAKENQEEYKQDDFFNFSRIMTNICLGEIRQNKNSNNYHMSFKEYLKIISGKTAGLFSLSMYAGAKIAERPDNMVKIYGKIGLYFGIIFQLIDDCLDYEMNLKIADKPVGKDFESGVITLPIIFALGSDKNLINEIEELKIDKFELINKVKKLGGVAFTKTIARKYYMKSKNLISKIGDNLIKEELLLVLDNIFNREV